MPGNSIKRWLPPPTGLAKVNVDALVARNQERGSFAAICRDEHGNYLGASAVVMGSLIEPEILEVMACREGLNLATDLYLQKVQVSMGCM